MTDDDPWNDPPGVGNEEHPAEDVRWPTHGFETAAWAGWLAVGYGLVTLATALPPPVPAPALRQGVIVGLLGVALLVGVRLGGGDPRVWRR
jgi:hypothetical protein